MLDIYFIHFAIHLKSFYFADNVHSDMYIRAMPDNDTAEINMVVVVGGKAVVLNPLTRAHTTTHLIGPRTHTHTSAHLASVWPH